jgi:hypothetical protein
MANVQDWVDDLNVEVPSCLELTIERAVRFSIQEFFSRSEAWAYEASVSLVEGVVQYTLPIPANTSILANKYVKVRYDNHTESLTSTLVKDLNLNVTGKPSSFASKGSVMFIDNVEKDVTCDVGFTLKPNRSVDEVPDDLADDYFESIRSGALMRLKSMVGKDWEDLKGADKHQYIFETGVALAKRESKKLRSRVRRPARFNKGFGW